MARPQKKPKASFVSSPIFKVVLGGVIGFVVIAVLGLVLAGGKENLKTQLMALNLHLDNTSELVSIYQKSVKSSDLRSTSASLYSILTNTHNKVENYLVSKYNYKPKSIDQKLKDQATLAKDGLRAELSKAKSNGTLDQVFRAKIKSEISTFMAEITDIHDATNDDELKKFLNSSYSSLKTLYEKLNSASGN